MSKRYIKKVDFILDANKRKSIKCLSAMLDKNNNLYIAEVYYYDGNFVYRKPLKDCIKIFEPRLANENMWDVFDDIGFTSLLDIYKTNNISKLVNLLDELL